MSGMSEWDAAFCPLPAPSTTAVQISSVLLLGFHIKLPMNKQFRTNPSEESVTHTREREQSLATLNGRVGTKPKASDVQSFLPHCLLRREPGESAGV